MDEFTKSDDCYDLEDGEEQEREHFPAVSDYDPNGEEWFEVFISGKNFPYGLAHISSKVSKQIKVDLRKTLGMMADGDSLPQTAIIESAAAHHQSSSGLMD